MTQAELVAVLNATKFSNHVSENGRRYSAMTNAAGERIFINCVTVKEGIDPLTQKAIDKKDANGKSIWTWVAGEVMKPITPSVI